MRALDRRAYGAVTISSQTDSAAQIADGKSGRKIKARRKPLAACLEPERMIFWPRVVLPPRRQATRTYGPRRLHQDLIRRIRDPVPGGQSHRRRPYLPGAYATISAIGAAYSGA